MSRRAQACTALLFVSSLLLASPADARRRDVPLNDQGLPVIDHLGQRIEYSREELEARPVTRREGFAQRSRGAGRLPSGVTARSGYAILGERIGLAGVVLSDADIVVSGEGPSSSPFFWTRYFSVHAWVGGAYQQVFVSRPFPGLVRLASADVVGGAAKEIVLLGEDGTVTLFDQQSREEIGGFTLPDSSFAGMALRDLTGDGKAEIVATTDTFGTDTMYVATGSGTVLWQRVGAGGDDVVVANMDADPSLEIATTSGAVADWASQTIQWMRAQGFGRLLATGDIDADGMEELLWTTGGSFLWAFDIDTQLPKWSMPVSDVGAMWVGNVDADARLELLVGEGQWGDVKAFDTVTRIEEWAIPNPDHGVTNIAVGDANANGVLDVLWGAGASSTGPDRLYIANVATHTIDWESYDLEGRPLSPQLGDVDGDGVEEIVTASRESASPYENGRIVVLDGRTLRVKAVSQPVVGDPTSEGLTDLRLRNVDADPALEIVVAGDYVYDGVVEIYDFTPPGTFTLRWTNATRPNAGFMAADVADVDADGVLEVVATSRLGTDGACIYVYSLATGAEEWHSFNLSNGWEPADGLAILTGGGGVADIVAMVGGQSLSYFTGTGQIRAIFPGPFRYLGALPGPTRQFVTGGDGSFAQIFERQGLTFAPTWTRNFGGDAIDGVSFVDGGKMAITAGGRLTLFPRRDDPPSWASEDYGVRGSTIVGVGAARRPLVSGDYALLGLAPWRTILDVQPPLGPAGGGTFITVTGNAFDPGARLFVGGRETVGTQVVDPTHMTGTTPALVSCTANDVVAVNPDLSFEIRERGFTSSCGTCPTIVVNPPVVPNAVAGVPYSQAFTQANGTNPITWSLTGSLPNGLTLAPSTGVLSGTPLQTGNFGFTVRATDGFACSGVRGYTLAVDCPSIAIGPVALPTGHVGAAYSRVLTQSGGVGTIAWTLTGALPPGLTFTPSTATISGTPTQAGQFPISATATDTNGCAGTRAYTLVVNRAASFVAAGLAADAAGNRVFEPGETVVVAPSWRNDTGADETVTAAASGFAGPSGAVYTIGDGTANYGTVLAGATASCSSAGDCYQLAISAANPRPATHWDAVFVETLSNSDAHVWPVHVGRSFSDVPPTSPFQRFIETLLHRGVTGGCGAGTYCPATGTTRGQMAVFVLVSREGTGYFPPACGTPVFADVPASSPFCRWIEELARRGVVGGCGGGNYCPSAGATREAMAVFVLRTLDPTLNPPFCTTPMFADVPASSPYCRWIEELARRGVVTGCGNGNYCPTAIVNREQMAVFLSMTFGLSLYGPD